MSEASRFERGERITDQQVIIAFRAATGDEGLDQAIMLYRRWYDQESDAAGITVYDRVVFMLRNVTLFMLARRLETARKIIQDIERVIAQEPGSRLADLTELVDEAREKILTGGFRD